MKRWNQFFKGEKIERTVHAIRFESPHEKLVRLCKFLEYFVRITFLLLIERMPFLL